VGVAVGVADNFIFFKCVGGAVGVADEFLELRTSTKSRVGVAVGVAFFIIIFFLWGGRGRGGRFFIFLRFFRAEN
jgi:hypothetical protein